MIQGLALYLEKDCSLTVDSALIKTALKNQHQQLVNQKKTVCECSNRDTRCAEETIDQPHPASDGEILSDNDNPTIFNYFTITADIT